MGLKDRRGSRGGDCGGLCGRSGWRVHGQGGDWGGLRRLGRLWGDRAGVGGWGVGRWQDEAGEGGERVNGLLAGGFDDRGVVERRAEAEEVCGDRGGRLSVLDSVLEFVELALGRAEIAPEELLLS